MPASSSRAGLRTARSRPGRTRSGRSRSGGRSAGRSATSRPPRRTSPRSAAGCRTAAGRPRAQLGPEQEVGQRPPPCRRTRWSAREDHDDPGGRQHRDQAQSISRTTDDSRPRGTGCPARSSAVGRRAGRSGWCSRGSIERAKVGTIPHGRGGCRLRWSLTRRSLVHGLLRRGLVGLRRGGRRGAGELSRSPGSRPGPRPSAGRSPPCWRASRCCRGSISGSRSTAGRRGRVLHVEEQRAGERRVGLAGDRLGAGQHRLGVGAVLDRHGLEPGACSPRSRRNRSSRCRPCRRRRR